MIPGVHASHLCVLPHSDSDLVVPGMSTAKCTRETRAAPSPGQQGHPGPVSQRPPWAQLGPPRDAPVWSSGAGALTALLEAGVRVHFVDSLIPVSPESSVKPGAERSVAQLLHLGHTNPQ